MAVVGAALNPQVFAAEEIANRGTNNDAPLDHEQL